MILAFTGVVQSAPDVRRSTYTCDAPLTYDTRTSDVFDRDLPHVVADDVLRVALPADPTSMFLVDGDISGFDFRLIRGFARSRGLQMRVKVVPSIEERLDGLRSGRFDVVAGRMSVDDPAFSSVVIHKGERIVVQSRDGLCDEDAEVVAVHRTGHEHAAWARGYEGIALLGDDVSTEGALDYARLHGDPVAVRRVIAEPLLGRDLVVVDSLGDVDDHLVFRSGSTQLVDAVEAWMERRPDKVSSARRVLDAPAAARRRTSVSPFDGHFKAAARRIGWRWTTLAAVSWQESRFNVEAVSVVGASGIMQIMPETAVHLGVENPNDPAQAIAGGATYFEQLDRRLASTFPDEGQRLPFVLASYNAGIGHIQDAVALAEAEGVTIEEWRDVLPWIRKLRFAKWSSHPAVKYGRFRGEEPIDYVDAILHRAHLYEVLSGRGAQASDILW